MGRVRLEVSLKVDGWKNKRALAAEWNSNASPSDIGRALKQIFRAARVTVGMSHAAFYQEMNQKELEDYARNRTLGQAGVEAEVYNGRCGQR